jgi:beta-1,4-N-acetylglucosaminyltransferase
MTTLFVTVGTTSFDALVSAALSPEFGDAAWSQGCRLVVVQLGRGAEPPATPGLARAEGAHGVEWTFSLALTGGRTLPYMCYRFKPNVDADVRAAALVVSHAGAGSVFEALRAGRPLVVAVNTALADNHQLELAQALAEGKHLLYGGPTELAALVRALRTTRLAPLPPLDRHPFVDLLARL